MNNQPTVSVCLPVFNGKDYLAHAIESVLAQTLVDFELLIADDQSDDGSSKIIEDYACRDKRIKAWRNTERKGLFANYNECIMHAAGRYIKPFAQDDLLEPNALADMSRLLDENPDVNLVSCAKRWIDDKGRFLKECRTFPEDRIIVGDEVVLFNLIGCTNWVGEPVTAMFRREVAGDGFNTDFYHFGDIEYWFRIVKDGNYAYVSTVLCSFRRHSQSATSKNLRGLFFVLDILRLWRLYRSVLIELGESQEMTRRRIVEILAMQLDHLHRAEGLTVLEVLAIPLPSMPGRQPLSEQAHKDPREQLYWLLREVTRILAELDDLRCRSAAEREHLNNQIANVRNSTSWRITGPFRYMVRLAKSPQRVHSVQEEVPILPAAWTTECSELKYENNTTDYSVFLEAIDYSLRYLSEKRAELAGNKTAWSKERRILEFELDCLHNSTSWKISTPLRQVSRLVGGKRWK
ncbi:MAG: glycosyltransferase family 2 protein [Candidatus Obscuribacterales bacterium]|nr:glycosyltransferase family 2 protein [Candidatus Obscuribacterales bacterium]